MGPSRCSSKKTRVVDLAHRRSGSRKTDNLLEQTHIGAGQVASLTTVVGTHNARALQGQPRLVRGQLQRPCVVDARQHTIASGSCCCTTR